MGNNPLKVFEELEPGNIVVFDGELEGELSLTMMGAMLSPSIKVSPTKVSHRDR